MSQNVAPRKHQRYCRHILMKGQRRTDWETLTTVGDPFHGITGLVKQYEPFIRKKVAAFCKDYPGISRIDFIYEAVRPAVRARQLFWPEVANDFSTLLRWHLEGLRLFAKQEQPQIPIYETDAKVQPRRDDEEGATRRLVRLRRERNRACRPKR